VKFDAVKVLKPMRKRRAPRPLHHASHGLPPPLSRVRRQLAALAVPALIAAWPQSAAAQLNGLNVTPPNWPAPALKSEFPAAPIAPSPSATPIPSSRKGAATPAATPASTNAQPPDLEFAAFQRGNYLTAFGLATQRATDLKDPKAMTLLGELYSGGLGVPQSDQKAADWYKLAADRGDRNAMFALAMFALEGRAGPRDREKSAKLLASAAKLGHPLAAYDLALLYIEGQLFPPDFKHAAALLKVAADAGNPEAEYALGTFYKAGRGVPKDDKEAVRLFGLSAIADDADAQVEYGIALYNGDNVTQNQGLATVLFRRAALRNNAVAQNRLAHILAAGVAVKADPVEAAKWHIISKAGGETDLVLDAFVDKLPADQRAAAEKAAKTWIDAEHSGPAG
jgi:uncharacterized protein